MAELVPVPASVFDDEFFRASSRGVEVGALGEVDSPGEGLPERFREPTHFSAPVRVQQEDARSMAEGCVADPSARVPSFGGAVAVPADHSEPDELDIPAFLRRGSK